MTKPRHIKKMLTKGRDALNKLEHEWEDRELQDLLYYYNLCKSNPKKLKEAIKVLQELGNYVNLSDIEELKNISESKD